MDGARKGRHGREFGLGEAPAEIALEDHADLVGQQSPRKREESRV